jgi:hypothetical protein
MSPSASPPTRVRQGASLEFQRRANALLDVARDEDIWSVSESEESDGSEFDASASYDTDGSSESDFSASQVDLRELEALIARLHARGAEFVRPKTTQKHRDIHSLVAAAPRASRPMIIPRGSIPGLPDPVICGLHSEGIKAQREGLSWMKPPGPRSGAAERTDAKRKRRADSSPESDDDEASLEHRKTKRKKRRVTETEAYLDRVANASRLLSEADRKRRGREIPVRATNRRCSATPRRATTTRTPTSPPQRRRRARLPFRSSATRRRRVRTPTGVEPFRRETRETRKTRKTRRRKKPRGACSSPCAGARARALGAACSRRPSPLCSWTCSPARRACASWDAWCACPRAASTCATRS